MLGWHITMVEIDAVKCGVSKKNDKSSCDEDQPPPLIKISDMTGARMFTDKVMF